MASTERSRWIRRAVLGGAALVLGCRPEYQVVSPVEVDPAEVLPCEFTPLDEAPWVSRYDCNPVFSTTDEPWVDDIVSVGFRAQAVMGHPVYQVWYSARTPLGTEADWAIGHAVSSDGTTWEPHPDNPVYQAGEGWDADSADQLAVVYDPDRRRYVLVYQGYNLGSDREFGMGLLTSSDGVDFASPVGAAPLIDLSLTISGVDYCWPLSMTYVGGEYRGYMAGHRPGDQLCQIYGFSSPDPAQGIELDGSRNAPTVVLGAGPEAYDRGGVTAAASVEIDGMHYLFYVGFAEWEEIDDELFTSRRHTLNVATSPDGDDWTKHLDNPLPVHLTEERVISGVAAQAVGGRVHLWVTDRYDELDAHAVGYYLFDPALMP